MEDLAALKTRSVPRAGHRRNVLAAHRRRDDVAARRRRRRQGTRSHPEDAHGLVRLRRSATGDHGHRPDPSTEKALKKAGLTIADIGLFELNEAFAVQVISLLDHFGIADDDPRVNQWGGAIALGHPLAASGVRLMIQLAAQFAERPDVRYGLTAMCVGLGQGGSVIWENPHYNGRKR
jgi:acetyl-CoA acetyltransferase